MTKHIDQNSPAQQPAFGMLTEAIEQMRQDRERRTSSLCTSLGLARDESGNITIAPDVTIGGGCDQAFRAAYQKIAEGYAELARARARLDDMLAHLILVEAGGRA